VEIVKEPLDPNITECIDSYFFNTNTGLVITKDNRKVMKTADGGKNFTDVTPTEGRYFQSLSFMDENTGWVVCRYKGGILKTTNGGDSWTNQSSDSTTEKLYSVFALDENIAFVGGDNGIFLSTADGGATWENKTTGITSRIIGIYAFDSDNLLILYDTDDSTDPTILISNNGGNSWKTIHLPLSADLTSNYLYDLCGANNGVAYISAENGTIFKSDDYGENWTIITIDKSVDYFLFIKTINGERVWTGGENGVTYYGENFGSDWSKLNIPSREVIRDIQVFDDALILLTKDQWFLTEDNGKSYKSYTGWTNCNFNSISSNGDRIMAVTSESANITISNDGGESWSSVSHVTNSVCPYLTDVLVSGGDTALYAGASGQIGYSVDGGKTWEVRNDSSNYDLYALGEIVVEDDGNPLYLAGGDGGLFFYTNDVTEEWTADSTGFENAIYDMFANNEQRYAVFTCESSIQKSLFDGFFFEAYHDSNGWDFNAVDFINDSVGFVVGDNGLLLKSTDSGDSWVVTDTIISAKKSFGPTYLDLYDIHFIDENTGFISASNGTLLRTDDVGDSWSEVSNIPSELSRESFFKMTWLTDTKGFIASSGGYILKVTLTPATDLHSNIGYTVTQFELKQNYPNPFNPATTIQYALGKDSYVNISVYNTRGQFVTDIINKYQKSGIHSVSFNGKNLASGIYFYKIKAGDFVQMKKMILLK
jgi:photosystem II stability/assembly factor-like uncharacterized protein